MTESQIEAAEDAYRASLIEAVSRQGIYRGDSKPQTGSNFMSSRRAVIAEYGGLLPRCMAGCACKSRSHELHKSRLR
ncbi:MAG TPA: hypothetical protein VJ694_03345, partial [Patescibacteria group bacterium]|nr:hypothetical protein [Patescibacteria group bacterium]